VASDEAADDAGPAGAPEFPAEPAATDATATDGAEQPSA